MICAADGRSTSRSHTDNPSSRLHAQAPIRLAVAPLCRPKPASRGCGPVRLSGRLLWPERGRKSGDKIRHHSPPSGEQTTPTPIRRYAVRVEDLGLADVWLSVHIVVPRDKSPLALVLRSRAGSHLGRRRDETGKAGNHCAGVADAASHHEHTDRHRQVEDPSGWQSQGSRAGGVTARCTSPTALPHAAEGPTLSGMMANSDGRASSR
jgi:hypothetical protein